jgi:hypothetical protein
MNETAQPFCIDSQSTKDQGHLQTKYNQIQSVNLSPQLSHPAETGGHGGVRHSVPQGCRIF